MTDDTVGRDRRLTLRSLSGSGRPVIALCLSSLLAGAAEAGFLVLITRVAFAIAEEAGEVEVLAGNSYSLASVVWIAVGLVCVRMCLASLASAVTARVTSQYSARLRADLVDAFLLSEYERQQQIGSGHFQELLTTYVNSCNAHLSATLNALVAALNLAALLGLALAVDPIGALVSLVAVSTLGLVLRPIRKLVRKRGADAARSGMEMANRLNSVPSLSLEFKAFAVEEQVRDHLLESIENNRRVTERVQFTRGMVPTIYTGVAYLAMCLSVALVAAAEVSDVSSLGAAMLVMLRSLSYGQNIQSSLAIVTSNEPFLSKLRLETQALDRARSPKRTVESVVGHEIDLRSIGYEYAGGVEALVDLTATIQEGEMIGIIGPSGSGKSTLVQILLGVRAPTSGQVLIDGTDLSAISRVWWGARVAFVPQTPRVVDGSIADNVAFFRPEVSMGSIQKAARIARIHDEIMATEGGYERVISPSNPGLSGGQLQRLSIARALAGDPEILVMDEPTSALDVASESSFRSVLASIRGVKTVVIVAHRMSTLEFCDRILVMNGGRMTAFGAPAELKVTSEFYRESLSLSGILDLGGSAV